MKLTDEQYEEIGNEVFKAGRGCITQATLGRAAVAAVAPMLLAEPTEEEAETYVNYGPITAMRRMLAARLASVTAKPDPAVEDMKEAIKMYGSIVNNPDFHTREAQRLVAVVDAARAKP